MDKTRSSRKFASAFAGAAALSLSATAVAQTATEVFQEHVSPIVQAKCINCHVEGGASGNTRLVFVPSSNAEHETLNQETFEDFLAAVDDGADTILDKISGRISHGGGTQVPEDSEEYGHIERFLELLEDDSEEPVEIIPDAALRGAVEAALGKSPRRRDYPRRKSRR